MPVLDLSAYKPVSGTLEDANQIANGFQAVQNCINALDNNNFAAGKIFDPLKLMQDGAVAGQGLVWSAAANGGTGGWVPGSAGAMVQLYDSTLGVAAANFDITGISQAYNHLQIELWAIAASGTPDIAVTLNGDTGNNYAYQGVEGHSSTATSVDGAATPYMKSGFMIAGQSLFTIKLLNYRGAGNGRMMTAFGGATSGTGAAQRWLFNYMGFWNNGAAITRVTVAGGGANFAANSRVIVYGVL